jgi:hypothetical protein
VRAGAELPDLFPLDFDLKNSPVKDQRGYVEFRYLKKLRSGDLKICENNALAKAKA